MPDISITDQLDKPIETVHVDLSQPSSLIKYLKTELLHLAVFPDFLARKDDLLTQAATKPIRFQAKATHDFQLGSAQPEIDITPEAEAIIRVNASPGTSLADEGLFSGVKVPNSTGYVSASFQGSLDLGVSGSDGDLTFGFDKSTGVTLEYAKAFPLGAGEPTLGDAFGQTLSSYTIPADLSDLSSLGINDVAAVSGQGSLKVSGGISVAVSPNPLASVDLPLGAGTIAVQAGATLGLLTTFTISGSYQVRARRKDADTIELSFLQDNGTALSTDLSASGGVAANLGNKDLVAAILGAISKDPAGDKQLLSDLQPAELDTFAGAIKSGLNHSIQASLDVILSTLTDGQAAFQYEVQLSRLTPAVQAGIQRALRGDLSLLTAMEANGQPGAQLAPGLKMLSSVFSKTRSRGCTLKINLLGILNYLTLSELIRRSETLTDGVTGDVTIKETVTGNSITALTAPLIRNEALRKAIFDSVMVTSSYRAGKAIALPELNCEQVHFALHQKTDPQTWGGYLSWFLALNLLTPTDQPAQQSADGGPSTCILRTSFKDADCVSMFLDSRGVLRPESDYLEIGRHAMQSLLDPQNQAIDNLREQILDNTHWPSALQTGANVNLGALVGASSNDPRVQYLVGDVFVITTWAEAMAATAALVQDLRTFVADADPSVLLQNDNFKNKRDALQKHLAAVVKASKTRFDQPWGMLCLFRAAGSPPSAYGRAKTAKLTLERGARPVLAATA